MSSSNSHFSRLWVPNMPAQKKWTTPLVLGGRWGLVPANACWGKERLPRMMGFFPLAVTALLRSLGVCDPEVTYGRDGPLVLPF